MFWTIAAQILAVLGPMLTKWLKDWLDGKLKTAAKKLTSKYLDGGNPIGVMPSQEALHREMLQNVRNSLWFWQRKKIAFVNHALATIPPVSSGSVPALRATDVTKLSNLSQSASGNDD